MDCIVNAALKAARPGGATYQYFKDNAYWQGSLRQQLASLVAAIPNDPITARSAGLVLLNEVRVGYKTQRLITESQIVGIYDDCIQVLNEHIGWQMVPQIF